MERQRRLASALYLGVMVMIGIAAVMWVKRPIISNSLAQKTNFSILFPAKNNAYRLDRDSVTYSEQAKILTLVVHSDKYELTMIEQATPSFVASTYDFLRLKFTTLKGNEAISNEFGTAFIAQDESGKGMISMMNTKGTLLLVRTGSQMTADEWRTFYHSLAVKSANNSL